VAWTQVALLVQTHVLVLASTNVRILTQLRCSVCSNPTNTDSAVLQCVLQSNGKCGVLATDGGKVACEGCEIKANRMYGLVCQSGAQATLTSNNICHNVAVRVPTPLY